MTDNNKVKHGQLHFSEYISNDFKATSDFLMKLFGWQIFIESENEVYLKHDDNPVVNVYQRDSSFEIDGVPPHVKNYVAVDDYEESKAKAVEMGATLVHEAEVPDYCKLGVLKIPGDLFVAIVRYYKGHY